MKNCYITFRSVTAAQRGEVVLHRGNMEVMLQRTPRWMEEQGCGYSLRLQAAEVERAKGILKNNGISYRKIYLQRENGVFEEWKV